MKTTEFKISQSLAKLKGPLLFLAIFVLPYFLMVAYFSYFDKDSIYLREGAGPPWMLNPEDLPVAEGFPQDFPALYTLGFTLNSAPVKAVIRINSVSSHVLKVNGVTLSTEDGTKDLNWKFPTAYDITPHLVFGVNSISVRVRAPYSRTALKAEGEVVCVDGSRIPLNSSDYWFVASLKTFAPLSIMGVPNVPAFMENESFFEKLAKKDYWPGGPWIFSAAFVLIALIIFLPGMPRLDNILRRLIPEGLKGEKAGKFLFRAVVTMALVVSGAVVFNNVIVCDVFSSGDFRPHKDYMLHFLNSWRVPLASEGFEMYNPPTYHILTARLYKLIGHVGPIENITDYGQLINSVSAILYLVFILLILRRLFKDRTVVALALVVTAFLPVSIYKAASISGDSLNTLFCTAGFYFWLRYTEGHERRFAVYMGMAFALGMLTRYATFLVILGISLGFLKMFLYWKQRRRRTAADYLIMCLIVAAVSGWFYYRNFVHFHRMFPTSGERDLFFFRQLPGFRNWNFYTDISELATNNPLIKESLINSFIVMMYNTFWFDSQRTFLPAEFHNVTISFTCLALALLPTFFVLSGIVRTFGWGAPERRSGRGIFAFSAVMTLAISFLSFTLISFKAPTYAVVKSGLLLSTITSFAYLLASGLDYWVKRMGKAVPAVWITALCAVVLYIFKL